MESFLELELSPALKANLKRHGFQTPTPVQAQAIPPALLGKDVVATAQTGTGKTLAFALPMVQKLVDQAGAAPAQGKKPYIQAVILSPTRELAMQIDETFNKLTAGTTIRSAVVVGGMSESTQLRNISRGVQVLIATPGRMCDFLRRRLINLSRVEMMVLDEADRMLDMGFLPDLDAILEELPEGRQTLLFSATIEKSVAHLVEAYAPNHVRVTIGDTTRTADKVELHHYEIGSDKKLDLLAHLLRQDEGAFLVFARTKHGTDRLAKNLAMAGFKAARIHGDRTQGQRNQALRGFKNGDYRVLVATDVAARGIHVDGISHVVNFDLPMAPEDFIHRVGRTGRAGAQGVASTFSLKSERNEIRRIERTLKLRMIPMPIPDGLAVTHLDASLLDENFSAPIRPEPNGRAGGRGFDRGYDRGPSFGRNSDRGFSKPYSKGFGGAKSHQSHHAPEREWELRGDKVAQGRDQDDTAMLEAEVRKAPVKEKSKPVVVEMAPAAMPVMDTPVAETPKIDRKKTLAETFKQTQETFEEQEFNHPRSKVANASGQATEVVSEAEVTERPIAAKVSKPKKEHADSGSNFEPKPAAKKAFGAKSYGEKSYGDKPFGDKPYGDKPKTFGAKPFGAAKPYAKKSFGDKPYADKPYGDKPFGAKKSFGDKPYAAKSFGDKPYKSKPFGEKTYGDKPAYGDKPYADKPYGDKPKSFGAKPFGAKAAGPKTFGNKPFGAKTFGSKPFADKTFDRKPYGKNPFRQDGDVTGGREEFRRPPRETAGAQPFWKKPMGTTKPSAGAFGGKRFREDEPSRESEFRPKDASWRKPDAFAERFSTGKPLKAPIQKNKQELPSFGARGKKRVFAR